MARHEVDREDLMAEATALRQRAELVLEGHCEAIVAGFRADGHWSLYFGDDPVYHFDAAGCLRRAFVAGDLYRSQGQTLARLNRLRTDQAVELVRRDLEPGEVEQFLSRMTDLLTELKIALERGSALIVRQVSEGDDFVSKLFVEIGKALHQKKLSPALTKR
jgi:hypothetical protein